MTNLNPIQIGQYVKQHYPQYKVIVASPKLTDEQFRQLLGVSLKNNCLFISKRCAMADRLIKDFAKRPCMADIDYTLWVHNKGLQAIPIVQEKDIDVVMRTYTETRCIICHEEGHENMESSIEACGERVTQAMPCGQCGKCICESCVNKLIKSSFEQHKSVMCPACRDVIIPYETFAKTL